MKSTIVMVLFVIFGLNSNAQKFIQTYFNQNWVETSSNYDATFVTNLKQTDSGWHKSAYYITSDKERLEMFGNYEDKEMHIPSGLFYWFYANGKAKATGKYIAGKKEGLWLKWYSDGSIQDSTVYHENNIVGIALSWYKNGAPKDSINLSNDGSGNYYEWFSNGAPSAGGRYINYKKMGKWVYFHNNGKVSAYEQYNNDSITEYSYFSDDGNVQADTNSIKNSAEFKGGKKGWNNFVTSYLHSPNNVKILNSHRIAVVVEFTVDELGKVKDIELACPYHPLFDRAAINFLKSSPLWIPAKNHNRFVEEIIRIPIVFSQSYN